MVNLFSGKYYVRGDTFQGLLSVGKQVSDFNSNNFYISPISRIMNEHVNAM